MDTRIKFIMLSTIHNRFLYTSFANALHFHLSITNKTQPDIYKVTQFKPNLKNILKKKIFQQNCFFLSKKMIKSVFDFLMKKTV